MVVCRFCKRPNRDMEDLRLHVRNEHSQEWLCIVKHVGPVPLHDNKRMLRTPDDMLPVDVWMRH